MAPVNRASALNQSYTHQEGVLTHMRAMATPRETKLLVDDLVFTALETGIAGQPVCLCLHGFPDHARSWRHLLPALAAAGYHAVAPYTRGYTPGSIPSDGRYDPALLARDILGLLDALHATQAIVIGHDLGADAAHGAAILAPERIRRLVTMGGPHPMTVLAQASYAQLKRWWYCYYFLLPEAESVVAADDYAFLDRLWADWSPGFVVPTAEREALKATFRVPGVFLATLGYYRCLYDRGHPDPVVRAETARVLSEPIRVPTLYLHGVHDGCIGVELTQGMEAAYPAGLTKLILEDAGHFVQVEQPDRVNQAILQFIGPAAETDVGVTLPGTVTAPTDDVPGRE